MLEAVHAMPLYLSAVDAYIPVPKDPQLGWLLLSQLINDFHVFAIKLSFNTVLSQSIM